MNTDILINELNARKQFLSSAILSISNSLSENQTSGHLRCASNGGNPEYYHVTQKENNTGKYITKDNLRLAKDLAQIEYDKKVLRLARSEYTAVCALLKKYSNVTVDSLYSTLHSVRRELITPIILPDDQFLEKWMNISYTKKGFSDDAPEFYTDKGERVRSKSEILIADTFNKMGIPYHYEFPFKTKKLGIIYPDFLVLNLRLRKSYFWEHCGRMDDPKYLEDWFFRSSVYAEEGIFPGDKLIRTYESKTVPLNMRNIERMIRHYLM